MPAEAKVVKMIEQGDLYLEAGELLHADPEEVAPVVEDTLRAYTRQQNWEYSSMWTGFNYLDNPKRSYTRKKFFQLVPNDTENVCCGAEII